MREILFRGETKKGEWVYGSPIFQDGYVLIRFWNSEEFEYEEYLIIPETIGQYTGLTDKNGTKIFEGDIILWGLAPCVAKYDTENARFMFYENVKYLKNGFNKDTMEMKEVIGNIHDNPELLGGDTK